MRNQLIIFVALIVFGCNSAEKTVIENRNNLFKDFTFLDIPISDLRIGATFIDGIGANGDGIDDSLLITQKSYNKSNIDSNRESKIKLDASLFALMGFQADFENSNKVSIQYSDVEIVTISDLLSLQIRTGTKYIYQGVKVNSVSIIADKSLTNQIKTNIKSNINSAEIEVNPLDSKDKIELSGTDIFVAYKLVKFVNPKTEVIENKMFGNQTSIGGVYEVDINKESMLECIEKSFPPNDYNPFKSLEENYPNNVIWNVEEDNGDKYEALWLLSEDCETKKYNFTVKNTGRIGNNSQNFQLDFLPKDQTLEYIVDSYFKDNGYVIVKLQFEFAVFLHKEVEDGTSLYLFRSSANLTKTLYEIQAL